MCRETVELILRELNHLTPVYMGIHRDARAVGVELEVPRELELDFLDIHLEIGAQVLRLVDKGFQL